MDLNKIPVFSGKVTVIGDVMLDSYWKGPSTRISPEAPVPVVKVSGSEDRAGGAANVALNITSLRAPCTLVGIVGEDRNAATLEKIVRDHKVDPRFIFTKNNPTITKLRIFSRNQQLLRLDFEDPFDDLNEDLLLKTVEQSLADSKVVIFSDYGKGSLASVQKMIKIANQRGVISIIDPKGTDFNRYRGATMLTPNMSEFEAVAGKVKDNDDLEAKALEMILKFDLKCLLVTRSEDGMSLIRPNLQALHIPTYAREVYDVTGAGDTVAATLAAALASGESLERACDFANRAAGIVVGKIGTSSVTPEELFAEITKNDPYANVGVVKEDELEKIVRRLQAEHKKVVMTNGCFDLLHQGHVTYLKQAKELGDKLIVAVNSDSSVQRLKGSLRPIVPLEGRMAVLSALGCVDYVVPFDEDTPERLISRILPDVLVKGGDYTVEQIAGHKQVLSKGGSVVVLPFVKGCSTTGIVDKIKSQVLKDL